MEPVTKLVASNHNQVHLNTHVLNKASLDPYVYIEVNSDAVRGCKFYQADEVLDDGCVETDCIIHDSNCWFRGNTAKMNMEPGLHTYKLCFVNPCDGTVFGQFFSYIIQDDNPEKPYIYMKRESKESDT